MGEKISKIPKFVKISIPVAVVAIVLVVLLVCGVFGSKVTVPDIVKMKMDEAEKLLMENELTIFVDEVVSSDEFDANTILSQDPEAGEKVEKNTSIGVSIVQEVYQTEIPDITDYSKDLAVKKIEAAGAKVEIGEEFSDSVPAGTVISQSVKGEAKSSDTVKIVVSKGPKDAADKSDLKDVPNVVSKDKNSAKKALADEGIGMTVVSEQYSDKVKKGDIISQKTNAETGSVEVVVSKGSQKDNKVVVPNVVFRTQDEAKKLLEANDLKVIVQELANNAVSKGAVISQSVKPGTKVSAGSAVIIFVSSGKTESSDNGKITTKTSSDNKTEAPQTTKKAVDNTTASTTKKDSATSEQKTTSPKITTSAHDVNAEKQYVADFKITTDKTSAKAGDEIKVSVALKTNYRIFTVMLPVIYDGDVFEMQNTSNTDLSSFLTFEGSLAKTYKTNGNWKSVPQMYQRNSNESYWTKSDVMKKWKIAYASWSVDVSESRTPVKLSNEEVIVSFTLKVKSDVSSTEGRIFISPDFQKTSDCVKGILAVGRCKNETVDLNFVDRDQTIKVDRADVKIKIQ